MRLEDFIGALHACGWRDTGDAHHTEITKLHRRLFPVVADLEAELATVLHINDASAAVTIEDVRNMVGVTDCMRGSGGPYPLDAQSQEMKAALDSVSLRQNSDIPPKP